MYNEAVYRDLSIVGCGQVFSTSGAAAHNRLDAGVNRFQHDGTRHNQARKWAFVGAQLGAAADKARNHRVSAVGGACLTG